MPNVFKYLPGATANGVLYKGGFLIGNNTSDYGGTYYTGITPGASGYTILQNKSVGGPSIYVASNDTDLITFTTKQIAGTPGSPAAYSTASECLNYFTTQADKVCVNRDYEGIVTSDLLFNLDAGYTPSYPKGGTSWYDVGPNKSIAALINGPTYGSSPSGNLSFDGVDDYLSLSGLSVNTSGFTIDMSIYVADPQPSYPNFWAYWYSANGFEFGVYATGANQGRFMYKDNGATGTPTITSRYIGNSWVSLTIGCSSTTPFMYLNGSLFGTASSFRNLSIPLNNLFRSQSTFDKNFKGNQGYLRVYNRDLSSTEIFQNYQVMFPRILGENIVTSGLVGYYDAGYGGSYRGSGTNWYNVSGTAGGDGTLINGPTFDPSNGGSIVFDGIDDYVSTTTNSSLTSIYSNNQFTIQSWFQYNDINNYHNIMGIISSFTTNFVLGWRINISNNLFFDGFINNQRTTQNIATITPYINTWINITTTYTNGTLKSFLNGNLAITTAVNGQIENFAGNNFYIAAQGGYPQFKGKVSNAFIYNRVLSDSEVLQNYNAQKSRFGL